MDIFREMSNKLQNKHFICLDRTHTHKFSEGVFRLNMKQILGCKMRISPLFSLYGTQALQVIVG